jgi:hypothetical protein
LRLVAAAAAPAAALYPAGAPAGAPAAAQQHQAAQQRQAALQLQLLLPHLQLQPAAAATLVLLQLKMLRAWQKLHLPRCHLARCVLPQQAQRQQAKPGTGCSSKLLLTALHHQQQ